MAGLWIDALSHHQRLFRSMPTPTAHRRRRDKPSLMLVRRRSRIFPQDRKFRFGNRAIGRRLNLPGISLQEFHLPYTNRWRDCLLLISAGYAGGRRTGYESFSGLQRWRWNGIRTAFGADRGSIRLAIQSLMAELWWTTSVFCYLLYISAAWIGVVNWEFPDRLRSDASPERRRRRVVASSTIEMLSTKRTNGAGTGMIEYAIRQKRFTVSVWRRWGRDKCRFQITAEIRDRDIT